MTPSEIKAMSDEELIAALDDSIDPRLYDDMVRRLRERSDWMPKPTVEVEIDKAPGAFCVVVNGELVNTCDDLQGATLRADLLRTALGIEPDNSTTNIKGSA